MLNFRGSNTYVRMRNVDDDPQIVHKIHIFESREETEEVLKA